MAEVVVDIEGKFVAPLIQHNIRGAHEGIKTGRGGKRPGVLDKPDDWERWLYRGTNGTDKKLFHTGEGLQRALQDASREFRADRKRSMQSIVKATVFVEGDLEIVGKTEPDFIHESFPLNRFTGGRTPSYRPAFKEGTLFIGTIRNLDTDAVSISTLKEMLDHSGRRIGLGGSRPRFGRFIVTKFAERK